MSIKEYVDSRKIEDIDKAIGEVGVETFSDAKAMYDGDHWLNGRGWIGFTVDENNIYYQKSMNYIERMFTSQNVIREIVDREVRACVPSTPSLSFILKRSVSEDEPVTREERDKLEYITSKFFEWFKRQKIGNELTEMAKNLLMGGAGALRFVVPKYALEVPIDETNIVNYLFLHSMEIGSFAEMKDPITRQRMGVYRYKYSDYEGNEKKCYERTYIGEDGNTRIETYCSDNEKWEGGDIPVALGGEIPMFFASRVELVSQSVIQMQKNINLALTLMAKNALLAGFLERIFLNAMPPMKTIVDENGNEVSVPDDLSLGPNSVVFMTGIPIENDETGELTYTQPKVFYHEPTDVEAFTKLKEEAYVSILQEVHQLHSLLTVQTKITGESRRQARSEFAANVAITAAYIYEAMEWMARMFVYHFDLFLGENYSEMARPISSVLIDIGQMPADEVTELLKMFEASVISGQTLLERYGIKNPTRELDLVSTQQKQSIRYQESRSRQFLYLRKAGVEPYDAAILSGYGERAAKQIAESIARNENSNAGSRFEPGQPATNDVKAQNDITKDDSMDENPQKAIGAIVAQN